jgi:hypothetical protein
MWVQFGQQAWPRQQWYCVQGSEKSATLHFSARESFLSKGLKLAYDNRFIHRLFFLMGLKLLQSDYS